MDNSTCADIEIKTIWHSKQARHIERHFFQGIDLKHCYFPGLLGDKLATTPDGDWVSEKFSASELLQTNEHLNIARLGYKNNQAVEVFLRIVGQSCICKEKHGSHRNDLIYESLIAGSGLQEPIITDIDFYSDEAFNRIDDNDDAILYKNASLEDTFDSVSSVQLTELYSRYLKPGDRVLDMMCGAQSYLPAAPDNIHVTGIGLNAEELSANKQLNSWLIHNVNATPILPFENNTFDTIVFTAAVEYLTAPLTNFTELKRIIKSGGNIIVTFTDHWASAKSILLWSKLSTFERPGLVLNYFMQTSGFSSLQTETIQGLLRAEDDKYARQKRYADPVFAVIATVA